MRNPLIAIGILVSGYLLVSLLKADVDKRLVKQDILNTIQTDNQLNTADRIADTSRLFLGVDYQANTLTSINAEKETLVKNLNHVDNLTLLDYVISLAFSDSFAQFEHNLSRVRYLHGHIDYITRRHFFSDWLNDNTFNLIDMTAKLSTRTVTTLKHINQKTPQGQRWIPSVPITDRHINFIPRQFIDENLMAQLKNGDLIGIYSHKLGLDVSHTGILINKERKVYLRHASLKNDKVVDTPLMQYLKNKPGILIYRFNNPTLAYTPIQ
ncbi:N-acetylmuramoyl-L-alanine amidase-like domain-containing protein [Vibrio ostreicida]|uniref:DUF1460 domain-containing protein n=1 Tax=Vibrio ostreicida TaxID=526588 RepID=A0ABT8BSV3_9VIBR|nr:N-acetylmuramoyl-L-alanine amidase-like domain-containing protein [Vibrio ostreicida]MDN3609852.1 DUF1460 domain-containing protein [Vibrio ostreicida]NPD09974.1 DUF1460 domain-containing protein [Vibrio ostreicida]